jgi:inorganic pyrophosphatase
MRHGLTDEPTIRIEVPRLGLVKRRGDGRVDFVSPVPCPYNYGSVVGTLAPDGDPCDAVVLGPRLPAGTVRRVPLRGAVGFVDAGTADPKLVCADAPLTPSERRGLLRFFRVYAVLKGLLNAARGRRGATRCLGWRSVEDV